MDDAKIIEDLEKKRKRLIYRSWHRGTREMDLLMGSFADAHVTGFSESEISQYEEILGYSDPDLYNWISGREECPANVRWQVMDLLLRHSYTKG